MEIAQYKSVRKTLEQKVRQNQAKKDVVRQLVDNMLVYDVPIAARYEYVDVIRVLQDNCLPFNPGLEALIRGLGILEKYGKNLLRHDKPPLWRIVRLSNSIFKQEVKVIRGSEEILAQLGYSKHIEDGLSYPDDRLIPDIPVVTSVTTDILLLRNELILLAHHEHRQENAFYSYIPAIEIKMVQEKMGFDTIPNEPETTLPLLLPPSYQEVFSETGINVKPLHNIPSERRVVENGNVQAISRKIDETPYNEVDELCDLCGQKKPDVKCNYCNGKGYCLDCNELWHNNPKRKSHRPHLIFLTAGATNSATGRTNTALDTNGTSMIPRSNSRSVDSVLNVEMGDSNSEGEFTMRMNRKAIELIDISDPIRKRKRLMESLGEIDKEAAKYRKVIEALQVKANDKSQLVQHITGKLDELEELKEHLKVICGHDNFTFEQNPSMSVEHHQTAPSLFRRHTQIHDLSLNSLPAARHSTPVMEASLIDLEPPAEPSRHFGEFPSSNNTQLLSTMLSGNDFQMSSKLNSVDNESEFHQPATMVHKNGESESQVESHTGTLHVSSQPGSINIEDNLEPSLKRTAEAEEEYQIPEENEYRILAEIPFTPTEEVIKDSLVERTSHFLSNLSPTELQNKIKKEELRFQTTQFLDSIRAGDGASFRPEQVEVAIHEIDKVHNVTHCTPNSWLEQNWVNVVQNFIVLAKSKGFRISPENAEDVLLEADNVFEKALDLITTAQNEQIQGIAEHYGFDMAKRAYSKHKGDKYHALASLQKNSVTEVFQEFQESDNDQATELKLALQNNDEIVRKNAITAQLQLNDGIYAETFCHLLNSMPQDLTDTLLEDVIEAVTGNGAVPDVQAALHYLDNECMICMDKFPRSKITCLSACGDNECRYCLSCLEQHLTVCVNDKNIRDIVCPVCSRPEFGCDEETKTNFINHVDVILRNMPDSRVHEIFQQKLRDFTLMRLSNFRWCSHCSGGFQFDAYADNIKMLCPFCRKYTCYKCKKQWEPQHDGISCEQFQRWKEANDPEFQAVGLARHLRENGIDCPECKFRYALAKGGCMHFKCTQCSHEFCSGCSHPFKHGRQCGKLPSCVNRGLHAHHPRDCLNFLRDAEPKLLLKLLKDNGVQVDQKSSQQKTCVVMEQKETPTGLKDAPCDRAVEQGCAGLCKLHYMEYLVNLVNTHGLDPADIFTNDQLKACLHREDIVAPDQYSRESDVAYRTRLLTEVKKLPLIRRTPDNS